MYGKLCTHFINPKFWALNFYKTGLWCVFNFFNCISLFPFFTSLLFHLRMQWKEREQRIKCICQIRCSCSLKCLFKLAWLIDGLVHSCVTWGEHLHTVWLHTELTLADIIISFYPSILIWSNCFILTNYSNLSNWCFYYHIINLSFKVVGLSS